MNFAEARQQSNDLSLFGIFCLLNFISNMRTTFPEKLKQENSLSLIHEQAVSP